MRATDPRTVDAFHVLHEAGCAKLGIDPGRGSRNRMAKHLGVGAAQYSNASSGYRGSLELLARWAGQLGLTVIIPPEGPIRVEP